MKRTSGFGLFFDTIKRLFISGLIAILPLATTVAIIAFALRFVHSWLKPINAIEPAFLRKIPYAEVVFVILLIILLGAILQLFVLQKLVKFFEKFVKKIPVLGQIYSGTRQLTHALSPKDKDTFKFVVMVEFPREGIYSLGFVTGDVSKRLASQSFPAEEFYNVFVPIFHSSGYYLIMPKKDCIITDLTKQEALTLILSAGIINPEHEAHDDVNHETKSASNK